MAELWQSLLSRPVARHHDFFELGGDSLMATRMVAQLNRRGIARANLQDLFSHSTLSDFCAHLQAATSGEDNPIPLCQGDGEETLFVFHASDGDISAWLPLASALNRRVFGLKAKSPQRFATLDQMIDEYVGCIRRQQPHGPYVLAGWSYGAFLAAGAAQRLYAKGEQVRMVLIDPVCRQDFCCENRAALLRLLAEGQTPLALPEHFDQQTPDSQLADFISLAKTAGMVSQNLTLQAAETWLDNIAHLLRLLTEHTPGESVPVPCLMVYAAGRPARWTPAETEWQGWINNADDAVIEASHWQIMMEAPTFRLVRNTLRAGFAQPQRNRRTRYDAVRLPKTTRTDCGRQIWRNVPECLYAAPEAGTGRPAGAGKRPFKRAGSCVWHSAVYLAGTDNQDAGYRLYCRAFDRRRRNRYAACQTLSDARRTRHSGASPPPG